MFYRCLSVHRGGVCLSACWETPPGRPPARETPLAKGTPLPRRPSCPCQPPRQGDPLPLPTPPAGRPPQGDPPARETSLPAKKTPPPGPHPGGKLRGIRSRPTPKGEIEGDQIQAHTQGGKLTGIRSRPTPTPRPTHKQLLLRAVHILLECILVQYKNSFQIFRRQSSDRNIFSGLFTEITRMHSSRMRTVRCSSRLLGAGGGGVCLGGGHLPCGQNS